MKARVFVVSTVLILALGFVVASLVVAQGASPQNAQAEQADEESQREMEMAQAAERAGASANLPPIAADITLLGPTAAAPLFVGISRSISSTFLIDPSTGKSYPQFEGVPVWGSAYDADNDRVLFITGSGLYEWPAGSAPNLLGTITSATSGATLAMVGLAYHDGTLYAIRNVSSTDDPEAVYTLDPANQEATLWTTYVSSTANVDLGGLAADPNSGTLYATNDDDSLRGLVEVDMDGNLTLVAPYPDGQSDIDGLAISDSGQAYLVPDEPGLIYVYDFATMTYTTPISNPWTTSENFSAATWLPESALEGPAISLEKTVGTDPNVCATTSTLNIDAETDVTYCYEVTNTGTVTLTLHDLDDSELGNLLTDFPYILAPGASAFLTQTATISSTTVNTATWTAANEGPTDVVTATATATVTFGGSVPGITLSKTVGTDPGECATTDEITVEPGTAVTYCYEVTNTGSITYTLHDLDDSELGAVRSEYPYELGPGATLAITETAVITSSVTNTATWTAYNEGPTDVVTATDSATVTVSGTLTPAINITPENFSLAVGENGQLSRPLTISNTGTADLQWSIAEAADDCNVPGDVPWLSVSPQSGTTTGGSGDTIEVTLDATILGAGDYSALLCVQSNDPNQPTTTITVSLNVFPNFIRMPIVMGSPQGNP